MSTVSAPSKGIQSDRGDFVRRKWPQIAIIGIILIYPLIDKFLLAITNNAIGGYTGSFVNVIVFAMLALGLNIVIGYAGLLDLGYAAFFAIGAYSMALLTTPSPPWVAPRVPFPFNYFWIAIFISAAFAACAGVLLGLPTIPLRGDYLAIVTLGFGEIVPVLFRNLTCISISVLSMNCVDLTAGERGVNPIALPVVPFTNIVFNKIDLEPWYYVGLGLVVFLVFFNSRLEKSRLGRAWMAMREDEDAAAAMGIDVVRTKLLAFAMGATVSGFAGAYYASYIQGVFPSTFEFATSIIILCAVILGGIGNPYGALLGAIIIVTVDTIVLPTISNFFSAGGSAGTFSPSQIRYGLFGAALIIMMLKRPEGLLPSAARARELHEAEQEALLSGDEVAQEELQHEGIKI